MKGAKAARYLEEKFRCPALIGPTPIGIRNTDTFLHNLKTLTGKPIPPALVRERGIALDAITDLVHMFLADKKVAIYGNPDSGGGTGGVLPRSGDETGVAAAGRR